jgi:hypothetical protein
LIGVRAAQDDWFTVAKNRLKHNGIQQLAAGFAVPEGDLPDNPAKSEDFKSLRNFANYPVVDRVAVTREHSNHDGLSEETA